MSKCVRFFTDPSWVSVLKTDGFCKVSTIFEGHFDALGVGGSYSVLQLLQSSILEQLSGERHSSFSAGLSELKSAVGCVNATILKCSCVVLALAGIIALQSMSIGGSVAPSMDTGAGQPPITMDGIGGMVAVKG